MSNPNPAPVEPLPYRGTFHQQSNHDKLSSDRFGEELNPDAWVWRRYEEEVKESDVELVRKRNEDLNNMLLFATLFSAIVTAFVVESTNLLEEDSSGLSTQLLLALVQSQRRIEAGIPDLTFSPIEIPEFEPSASARAINVLWFASLVISLGASVVALLVKEWLSEFTSYHTLSAYQYALERQNRIASLDTWNIPLIIDLLPTFLNFSLFLFSIGLILRLWLLDLVVASSITIISTTVCGFYLFFVISGVRQGCPYKTRLSGYFACVLDWVLKSFPTGKSTAPDIPNYVVGQEIGFLAWFLPRCRDPMLRSSVTQSLAGLKSLKLGLPTFLDSSVETSELQETYKRNSKDLAAIFEVGSQAMDQLQMAPSRSRNEVTSSGGINVARLAVAIGEIYPHALTWQLCTSGVVGLIQENSEDDIYGWVARNDSLIIDFSSARRITQNVFIALDPIWEETSPTLTPSAYAYLVAAELKIIRHALAFLSSSEEDNTPASSEHELIEIGASVGMYPQLPYLDQKYLQMRCTKALTRTALVIKSSLNHLKSHEGEEVKYAVTDLLLEATELVIQEKRKAGNGMRGFGTDPNSNTMNKEASLTVATESNPMHRFTSRQQVRNFELMESLVKLCYDGTNTDTLRLEAYPVAAFNLLLKFWPTYLKQWKIDEHYGAEIPSWAAQEWVMIPFQTTPYDSQVSAEIILYQSIVLTYIAIGLWVPTFSPLEPSDDALQLVLGLLFSGVNVLPKIMEDLDIGSGTSSLYHRWLPANETLEKWISVISDSYLIDVAGQFNIEDETLRKLGWCIAHLIAVTKSLADHQVDVFVQLRLNHLSSQSGSRTPEGPEHSGLQVDQAMKFIHAASQATGRDATTPAIAALLGQVTGYIEEASAGCHICLHTFTGGPGFHILANAGPVDLDVAAAAATVCAVMNKLFTAGLQVEAGVVPSLLQAMCCVCRVSYYHDPGSFTRDALFQLKKLPGGIGRFVTPTTLSPIQEVLRKMEYWEDNPWWRGGTSDLPEIILLQNQVQQCIDQQAWKSYSKTSGSLSSQEPIHSTTTPPDPETDTSISEQGSETNSLAQSSYVPAPPRSDRVQSLSDALNGASSPEENNRPGGVPDGAVGSGQPEVHLDPPAEVLVPWERAEGRGTYVDQLDQETPRNNKLEGQ